MRLINTKNAVGHVLCHDITRIVKGEFKGVLFKKGHIIRAEDIEPLLNVGKEHVYIWQHDQDTLHEDEAAQILKTVCIGENMSACAPKEGKIELRADIDGLFLADAKRLRAINALGEIVIASRNSGFTVKKGDKLCGMRVVPLVIKKEKLDRVVELAGDKPVFSLLPIKKKNCGVIATGNEIASGRIRDDFTPVIRSKLDEYGAKLTQSVILPDDENKISERIKTMLDDGLDMVFVTGGMSVDPDDKTPLAIRMSGADIISYGAPVLPGAMLLLAYTADKRPVCGLPGCVMYERRTVFDGVLAHLLADVIIDAQWLSGLGDGGLCLNCEDCRFPNCGFLKGGSCG